MHSIAHAPSNKGVLSRKSRLHTVNSLDSVHKSDNALERVIEANASKPHEPLDLAQFVLWNYK